MFQGGFQQPQWQQGFNHAPQRTGPPPAKKVKGNPIITRYPPPPGYRGPAQPQIPYQQRPYQQPQVWQQPGQPYNYAQPSHPGYPQQSYGVSQAYPQHFAQPYGAAQSQYQPMQYGAASQVPPTQYSPTGYAQSYGAPQAQTWQPQALTPQSAPAHFGPPQDWSASSTVPQKRRHQSMQSLDHGSASMDTIMEHAESQEDLDDDDFTGECYFASHPDEIDEDFSLGWISWKAALPNKRALPSTFAEAELEALAPRKPLPTDDESISDYFVKAKRHEALLSIRQTEYWDEVSHDSLFKELPTICSEIIPMQQLLSKYKNRPDPTWCARTFTPTPEPESEPISDAVSGAADTDKGRTKAARTGSMSTIDGETDVLGNLEQALRRNSTAHSRHHSRASSVSSVSSQRRTRPEPLMPIRDQAQENILASLGVTGSPKMVYQTPGPAIGAPPSQQQETLSRLDRDNARVSTHGITYAPPPPPPPPPGHPPNQHHTRRSNGNGYNSDRRGSNASHRTASGSDWDGDQDDATPRPKSNTIGSRKRRHDSESDTPDDRRRQDDDETPKPRRKFSRTDDPWSARRW